MSNRTKTIPERNTAPPAQGEVLRLSPGIMAEFAILYKLHYSAVQGYLRSRGVSVGCLEDSAQDVLLRAWEKRDSYDRKKGSEKAWFLGIAENVVLEWRRKKIAIATACREKPSDELPDETVFHAREEVPRQALRDAVEKLPPKQREAITLVYYKELKPAEAAVQVGCKENVFQWRLADGRARLRHLLVGHHNG